MTKDEALTMCLEYIETNKHERKYVRHAIKAALEQTEPPPKWEAINNILNEYGLQAIDFVADWKAAQPVQEPVACRFCHSKKGSWTWQCYQCGEIDDVQQPPPPPLPVQEPVKLHKAVISAWGLREVYFDEDGSPSMHRSPPQRPWVGLTEQDMPSGEDPMFDHQYFFAGMVYAAKVLQAKNT